jgi:hypothetical protein
MRLSLAQHNSPGIPNLKTSCLEYTGTTSTDPDSLPAAGMTWYGPTAEGSWQGQGELVFESRGFDVHRIIRLDLTCDDGRRAEGEYLEGEQSGRWIITHPDGLHEEGAYLGNKRDGPWLETRPDGSAAAGAYAGGRRHGLWITTPPDGGYPRGEERYVHGARRGPPATLYADGQREEGERVGGERHGHWTIIYPDGRRDAGEYVAGEKQGRWVEARPDGTVWERTLRNGKRVGPPRQVRREAREGGWGVGGGV